MNSTCAWAMTTNCKKMNYECGQVKEDGMNFEVKHLKTLMTNITNAMLQKVM
jgi:hypothetical protein